MRGSRTSLDIDVNRHRAVVRTEDVVVDFGCLQPVCKVVGDDVVVEAPAGVLRYQVLDIQKA